MAAKTKSPTLRSPSRLTIGSASVAGFVWMTTAMGPIVNADEPTLVDLEPVPDPGSHTIDPSFDAVADVEPAAAPALIIIQIHRTVAADPADAAITVAAEHSAPENVAPPTQAAPKAQAAPKQKAAPKAKEQAPKEKAAPKAKEKAPAPAPPPKTDAAPPQTKASG